MLFPQNNHVKAFQLLFQMLCFRESLCECKLQFEIPFHLSFIDKSIVFTETKNMVSTCLSKLCNLINANFQNIICNNNQTDWNVGSSLLCYKAVVVKYHIDIILKNEDFWRFVSFGFHATKHFVPQKSVTKSCGNVTIL